jgi:c-di-GMP-binding flagellar brake protein YcgR
MISMSATVTPSVPIPHLREEETARYSVHARTEILYLLRALQRHKLLVNLDLIGSRKIIVTSILMVDSARNLLILDSARDDALNQEFCTGKGARAVSHLDGIPILITLGQASRCIFEQLPALCVPLPASLVRLQRREHFRVHLPIANPVNCLVPSPNAPTPEAISMPILDIGCGGVALADVGDQLGGAVGQILADCRFMLPDTDPITVTLEIRDITQMRLYNGNTQCRLGCRFVNLPHTAELALQRFITHIEYLQRGLH